LQESLERVKHHQIVIGERESTITNLMKEVDELEKKLTDSERNNEALSIKSTALEKQLEVSKKKLDEKVGNLNEILSAEKESRENWSERYEKEQKDHTQTRYYFYI
jgi:septal ring factor EnvC (AmiA/AmiB activator)